MDRDVVRFLDKRTALRYYYVVKKSFGNKLTEKIWNREKTRFDRNLQCRALRKLSLIHHVIMLDDLRQPPGNRLEALSGDREGQHSIRINLKWRICFCWEEDGAYEVEIVDYH